MNLFTKIASQDHHWADRVSKLYVNDIVSAAANADASHRLGGTPSLHKKFSKDIHEGTELLRSAVDEHDQLSPAIKQNLYGKIDRLKSLAEHVASPKTGNTEHMHAMLNDLGDGIVHYMKNRGPHI